MTRLLPLLMILGTLSVAAAPQPASVTGQWLTEKKNGIVEIFSCGNGKLCGRLIWLRIAPQSPNKHALDLRNPDERLRDRPLCGLIMMGGFAPAEPGSFGGGWIYDPESGHTYSAHMRLEANGTLLLRGFVAIPLFGESQVWMRFTGAPPHCPTE